MSAVHSGLERATHLGDNRKAGCIKVNAVGFGDVKKFWKCYISGKELHSVHHKLTIAIFVMPAILTTLIINIRCL